MTAINTNVGALNARLYALGADRSQQQAMERLSSGLRVNSAADDAAGLAVAGKMESQLRGINMSIRRTMTAKKEVKIRPYPDYDEFESKLNHNIRAQWN